MRRLTPSERREELAHVKEMLVFHLTTFRLSTQIVLMKVRLFVRHQELKFLHWFLGQ